MQYHAAQLREVLQRAVGTFLLRSVEFPPGMFVTVDHVRLSSDGCTATVAVAILPDAKRGTALRLLRAALPSLQSSLSETLTIRRVPRVRFVCRTEESDGAKKEKPKEPDIDTLLDEIAREQYLR